MKAETDLLFNEPVTTLRFRPGRPVVEPEEGIGEDHAWRLSDRS